MRRTTGGPLGTLVALSFALAACSGDSTGAAASDGAVGDYTVLAMVDFRTVSGDTLHALDASSERVVSVFPPSEGGFIRGLLPALRLERRLRGVGEDGPFALAVDGEGAPLIVDPLVESHIDMAAFGPAAVDFFQALADAAAASTGPSS